MFGAKNGVKVYEFCRGIDSRSFLDTGGQLKDCVKNSVSTDVNYGIRFDTMEQVNDFFTRLSVELSERLKKYNLKGSKFTLKIRVRDPKAPIQTKKCLGCGACFEKTVSTQLNPPTNDPWTIGTCCQSLYKKNFASIVDCKDLRGIGLHMERLISSSSLLTKNYLKFSTTTKIEKDDTQLIDSTSFVVNETIETAVGNTQPCYLEKFKKFNMSLENYKNRNSTNGLEEDIDLNAIQHVLGDWICWSSNLVNKQFIHDEDVDVFKGYLFYILNISRDFDRLLVIMKLFKRLITINGCLKWVFIYKQISSEIQADFYLAYNNVLQLDD